MMPNNLILIRHGESEGNVAVNASKKGDHHYYTEKFVLTPGTNWRLTERGINQAAASGRWLKKFGPKIDSFFVSPYVRTRMTAVSLDLEDADWQMNRSLREREWGDLDSKTRDEFKTQYPDSWINKKRNPLYWAPPGGESIAEVAENRVRNVLDTLHREHAFETVIIVCHGETIRAWQLALERWSDEDFLKIDGDKSYEIKNGHVLWYSKTDPNGPLNKVLEVAPKIQKKDNGWEPESWEAEIVRDWKVFSRKHYTNEELWATIKDYPSVL